MVSTSPSPADQPRPVALSLPRSHRRTSRLTGLQAITCSRDGRLPARHTTSPDCFTLLGRGSLTFNASPLFPRASASWTLTYSLPTTYPRPISLTIPGRSRLNRLCELNRGRTVRFRPASSYNAPSVICAFHWRQRYVNAVQATYAKVCLMTVSASSSALHPCSHLNSPVTEFCAVPTRAQYVQLSPAGESDNLAVLSWYRALLLDSGRGQRLELTQQLPQTFLAKPVGNGMPFPSYDKGRQRSVRLKYE
ncbi:uncharacterized protein B0H18DRAFT_967303 [Fomitopsis serialis]|uniref:uncharacterized protein n=1 Tax=Fomitopsis serialis TaxID=139415 RepID=UPI002007A6D8|nr:uncharacterized protein B0H18DRAFT_967303 [Neoantrodia serialis]KAH9938471.1 hypothetical protein B0H18DRAFT_967303 [Neoantrodia serialis]